MRRLRYIIVSRGGGISVRLRLLARALERSGHRADVVMLEGKSLRWVHAAALAKRILADKPDCLVCDAGTAPLALTLAFYMRVPRRVFWGPGRNSSAILATARADERAGLDSDESAQVWAGWLERLCSR